MYVHVCTGATCTCTCIHVHTCVYRPSLVGAGTGRGGWPNVVWVVKLVPVQALSRLGLWRQIAI